MLISHQGTITPAQVLNFMQKAGPAHPIAYRVCKFASSPDLPNFFDPSLYRAVYLTSTVLIGNLCTKKFRPLIELYCKEQKDVVRSILM